MEHSPKQSYTIKIGPNDVLLGRGDHSVKNEGNIRFRQLVKAQKTRYRNVADVSEKHDISCEIIRAVRDRGGAFLRRVEPLGEAQELGVPSEEEAWVPAEESIVIKKVKQAFRDKAPKRENSSAGNSNSDGTNSNTNRNTQGHRSAGVASISASQQILQLQAQQQEQQRQQYHQAYLPRPQQQENAGEAARRFLDSLSSHQQQHQQQDVNTQLAQLAQLLNASRSSSQQQQQPQQQLSQQLSSAELQRRQGLEETLTMLRRQQQQNAQEQIRQSLLQQLTQARLQQQESSSSSNK